jgi:hypothetical protein
MLDADRNSKSWVYDRRRYMDTSSVKKAAIKKAR